MSNSACPLVGLASRGCRARSTLRAGQLLPPEGALTLGSDAGRPPAPPAFHRASWRLPTSDLHGWRARAVYVGHLN
jgi:hypothetical protein